MERQGKQLERAYAAGNYSDVHKLTKQQPGDEANRFEALTKLDLGQVAVGLAAIIITLVAALITLK